MSRWLAAALTVLVGAACARTPSGAGDALEVVPLSGDVSVLEDGTSTPLDQLTEVEAGAQIRTGTSGRAEVLLPGGASLELAPDAQVALDTEDGSEIVQGSVLVRSPGEPVSVRAGGAQIEPVAGEESIFRVDLGSSTIVAVYRGAAEIEGAAVAPVEFLSQVTVLAGTGRVAEGARPLEVRPNDPWDAELLGPAIDLGSRVLALERGLTRQLREQDARAVLAALDRLFSAALVGAIEPLLGEKASVETAARVAVAAVIANELAALEALALPLAVNQVLELQQQGAHWIVVIAKWGLVGAATALLEALGGLTTSITEDVAPPPAPSFTEGDDDGPSNGGGQGGAPAPQDVEEPPGGGGGGGGGDRGEKPRPGENVNPGGEDTTQGGEGDGGEGGGGEGGSDPPTCSSQVECTLEDIIDGP